jgi:hypothetical protein
VERILGALNAPFLDRNQCYFGGGTRIVLALNEYRESADIDFLCSSRDGYRNLRSTINNRSLGEIAAGKINLAREVVADRYGIRTFIEVDDQKIKFEIINEGRIDVSGNKQRDLHVPCLDERSCFAEKFLANADRWNDESFLSRDAIDLAYMIEGWGMELFLEGGCVAHAAYGDAVETSARAAARKLLDKKDYIKKCVDSLRVTNTVTLGAGLKKIAARGWSCKLPAQ